ncbi:rRNA methylases [Anaerolinea thermolimosa]|uniref:TrmH family RNA methyltransferase n=1 Tax=Anaerolinea thermolimosa TaxID=229919 RepID=UPI000783897B|nr:RNA methyltransferase [Anaerolinea thermolimosa]GAP07980.1 rRNA methylases [Anaerolinea thermolimosa]GAP07983.1 rRNA methylases [Anaerolinea thermolimosa]
MITSAQNPRVQYVRALIARRKDREEQGAFVVEGVRLLEEALASGWEVRLLLYAGELSPRATALLAEARNRGVDVEEVALPLFQSLADTQTPQGVLGVLARRHDPLPEGLNFAVVADGIRDPGNLGTLLRSAAAAGVQGVLLPPGTTDAFAPKVVRAGMGAHFRLPVVQADWEQIAAALKPSCRMYVAESGEGMPCWRVDLTVPVALVIGGEAEGASVQARALADGLITIPMPGKSESLNAGVAAGILLFEVVRQRYEKIT